MDFLKIHFNNAPWYRGVECLLVYRVPAWPEKVGRFHEPVKTGEKGETRVEFQECDQVTEISPTFRINYDEAQRMMDELWHIGIRPSEEVGSVGQLKATQDHLEDMREQNKTLLQQMLENMRYTSG